MASLYKELQRRNVFRVAAAYAAIAWLLAQIAETVLPVFDLPLVYLRTFFVLLGLGFPVAVVLAWVYDLTPEGIRKTDDEERAAEPRRFTGRKIDFVIIGALSVALLFLAVDRVVTPTVDAARSIAVLPFTVAEDDTEAQHLAVGIVDSLNLRLSKVPELRVISQSAISEPGGNPLELGRLLNVDAIYVGRMTRRGRVLEINTELIDVSDGAVLRKDRYTPQSSNLIAIDVDMTAGITAELDIELAEGIKATATDNPEAFQLYLEGRYFWNTRGSEGLRQSAEYYNRAVAEDPKFALAWSGLAESYLMIIAWGLEAPDTLAPRVLAAAEQAIDLDPTLAAPHATLAYFKTVYEHDWAGAREYFDRAIALNPNYSTAHHWRAFFLSTVGEHGAALESIQRAREFEPLSPIINAEVALFQLYAGNVEAALTGLEATERLDPGSPLVPGLQLRAYAQSGRLFDSQLVYEKWAPVRAFSPLLECFNGIALTPLGLEDEARNVYARNLALSQTEYVAPGALGIMAASIGEYDAAFAHFDAAVAERSMVLSWMRDPLLSNMRNDPRYATLMQSVGLEP